ncbi:MAG: hypothetical protein HY912_17280 [Desulfomonile tiedjei]|uniref:Uncharacterized protein n=1 Tax=Desulfomonile tiedjei TaxID=2358 RepID=A0A9D6V3L1_9BACT|nr:hypothetical protein [Desulfomonile tiedjei]
MIEKQIDEVVDAINRKAAQSEIQAKAKALEMFLESGKGLFAAPAKAAWSFIKRLAGSK